MATVTFGYEDRGGNYGGYCYFVARVDGQEISSTRAGPSASPDYPPCRAGWYAQISNESIQSVVNSARSYVVSNRIYITSATGGYEYFIDLTRTYRPLDATDIEVYLRELSTNTGISYSKLSDNADGIVKYLKTKNTILVADLLTSASYLTIKSFFSLDDDFDTMLPVWAITLRVSTATLTSMKSSIVSALESEGITANTINSSDALLIVKRFLPPTEDDIELLAPTIAASLGVHQSLIMENKSRIVDVLESKGITMSEVLTTTGLSAVEYAISPFMPAPVVVTPTVLPTPEVPFYEAYPPVVPPTVAAPEAAPVPEFPWLWVGIGTAIAVLFIVPSVIILRRR